MVTIWEEASHAQGVQTEGEQEIKTEAGGREVKIVSQA